MNKIILGTMNINYKYSSNYNEQEYINIINEYKNLDGLELDTAYYYGNTTTEQFLGNNFNLSDLKISTKANPWKNNDFTNGILGQLSPINLENQLNTSLTNLKLDNVDTFYLHCPDYETPINLTLSKVDELWRKEKFNNLGISNFSKVQLEEVINILNDNYDIKLKYYQGMYNLICRKVEEIFPLLNDNNICFCAYNPLAGGILTGKYKNNNFENDCRFKNNLIYQNIFWKKDILDNINFLFDDDCLNISYNWLKNYSLLRENDKIIIGASTTKQLKDNISVLLNDYKIDKLKLLDIDSAYKKIKHITPNYYY
jgi:aflatoxin B1 aldehyde reductase